MEEQARIKRSNAVGAGAESRVVDTSGNFDPGTAAESGEARNKAFEEDPMTRGVMESFGFSAESTFDEMAQVLGRNDPSQNASDPTSLQKYLDQIPAQAADGHRRIISQQLIQSFLENGSEAKAKWGPDVYEHMVSGVDGVDFTKPDEVKEWLDELNEMLGFGMRAKWHKQRIRDESESESSKQQRYEQYGVGPESHEQKRSRKDSFDTPFIRP
jgi:hypothetical protein